jgi:hypothetical protein
MTNKERKKDVNGRVPGSEGVTDLANDSATQTTTGCPSQFGYPIFFVHADCTPNSSCALALRIGFGLRKLSENR